MHSRLAITDWCTSLTDMLKGSSASMWTQLKGYSHESSSSTLARTHLLPIGQVFRPAYSSNRQCHVLKQHQHDCCPQGLGTDDQDLIRIIVSRCEVDLVDIKVEFQSKYHKTLGSFIKVVSDLLFGWSQCFTFLINSDLLQGDTSGDYRRILMALARED